jgi:DNA-binding beta-propeller fold protein YncE
MNKMSIRFIAAGGLALLAGTANAELMYGTSASNFLVSFDSLTPGNTLSGFSVTGLAQNEEVIGLDLRPSTGQLYALGSQGNMYILNRANGAATSLGQITGAVLNGSAFGFDFNPVADRIRIQSDVDQNLRVNPFVVPNTAIVDGVIVYAPGDANAGADQDVSFSAYSNNLAGALSTTLYAVDADNDTLSFFLNPNDGQLTTIGLLGVDIGPRGGFDISGNTGFAYLAALPAGDSTSSLYRVNLATGAITLIDEIAGGLEMRTLTIVPAPSSVAILGLAAFGLRRRRN